MVAAHYILLEPGGHSSADIAVRRNERIVSKRQLQKKQVWEMIAVRMQSEKSDSSPRATQTQQGSVQPLRKCSRKHGVVCERETKNECLSWLQDYAEEKRKEQEAQRERAEQHYREKMEFLSGLLNVFKDLNN